MINVLFVCLGNICRSPLAEAVFRQLVSERELNDFIQCDSAGTASYHIGDLPDRRTRENALEHGLALTHRARRISGEDFSRFAIFIMMDEANFEHVQAVSFRSSGIYSEDSSFLLREFDPEPQDPEQGGLNIPDPYYEDAEFFERVYQIIYRCCDNLLNYLIEQYELHSQLKK